MTTVQEEIYETHLREEIRLLRKEGFTENYIEGFKEGLKQDIKKDFKKVNENSKQNWIEQQNSCVP